MLTGNPFDMPQGMAMAGWWLMSNGAVLEIISNARWTYSSRLASGAGNGVALIGVVGINSKS